MAYTAITAGEVDADSPIDTVLMGKVKDNLIDHESRLGTVEGSYVADTHAHTGGAGAQIPQGGIANSAIGQAQLKSTTGAVSTSGSGNVTLPGGEYGFYPQVKILSSGDSLNAHIASGYSGTSYTTVMHLAGTDGDGGGFTAYAQQRYIQASPPYKIGDNVWGHFLFLLRKIGTGEIISSYEAEDPCWAYNGKVWLPKDHADRISEVPHPFADYWQKDPATDGLEIVLVNLNAVNTQKWREDNRKVGKGILEDLKSVLPGKGKGKNFADYLVPEIPQFTDKVGVIEP